jgi:hypothetical protein
VVIGGCDLQRRSTEHVASVVDAFHRRLERVGKPLMMAKIAVAVSGLGAIALDLCFGDARSKIAKAERRWSDEIGANSRNGGIVGSALKPSLEAPTRPYGAAKALLAESREARDFLTCFNVGRLVAGVPPW